MFFLILIWEVVFYSTCFFLFTSVRPWNLVFVSPDQFWWLILSVFFLVLMFYALYRQTLFVRTLGAKTRNMLFSVRSLSSYFWSYFWFRNAFVFLVFALARPAFGTKKTTSMTSNMEIIISLDVSNSMNVCDIEPDISRLDIAKRSINALINQLGGEKIGISIFAHEAYSFLPLTSDYQGAKLFVEDIQTYLVYSQGTNVKKALKHAYSMFSTDKNREKTVILITDGGNHEENPSKIFEKYKQNNIQLVVLGIGTLRGGLIPLDPFDKQKGYKKDTNGVLVHSKLNISFIRHIARMGEGIMMISNTKYPDLRGLLTNIKRTERHIKEDIEVEIQNEWYQIPLYVSVFCWIVWIVIKNGIVWNVKKKLLN